MSHRIVTTKAEISMEMEYPLGRLVLGWILIKHQHISQVYYQQILDSS
jgi:hypothetical protein